MAKARSRTAARKMKDRWKAKNWYNVLAPASFDNATIADTLSDNPDKLINRVTEVSMQDLTNDFRKSHIKLFFKVNKVEDSNAYTQFIGHTLTSDYLRRLIRRRRSKIDGVYEVTTRDRAKIRVKPFATTDKRIQNSQRKVIRDVMRKTISSKAKNHTMSEFIKDIIDGNLGKEIYQNCKTSYPVKRVEIFKTEVISQPTIKIEEKKPSKKKEKTEKKTEKETEPEKTKEVEKPEKSEEDVEKEKPEEKELEEEPEETKKKEDKKEDKKESKKTKKKSKAKTSSKTKKTTKKKSKAKKKKSTKKTTKKTKKKK